MGSLSVKRKAAVASHNVQKRPKTRATHRKAERNNLHVSNNEIEIDELPWQQVALPDRLDDAEGFFGLEEIDNVQVIKSGLGGRPRYKVHGFCYRAYGGSNLMA